MNVSKPHSGFIVPERITRDAYIDLLEQLEALHGSLDEIDSIIECYATGGFDTEGEFVKALDAELEKARGSNPAKEPSDA